MDLNNERVNNAIDILIAMTVEEISEDSNRNPSEVLEDFLQSRTAKTLYDEKTKLWWDGPSAIAEFYMQEVSGTR